MNSKEEKALRKLRAGGIYTPIFFGLLFIGLAPLMNVIDPSGGLAQKLNSLPFYSPPTTAIGGMLLFWGVNTLIYFKKYLKARTQNA
jgi:hypothetical protein